MAANLDFKEDGTAALVSIGETPWHGEGTLKLDRNDPDTIALSKDLDRALQVAGLDFEVAKYPTYFHFGADVVGEGQFRKAKGGNAIVRKDRMTAIGSVGDDYTPLQNIEAFGPARPLLEQGLATIETAGALEGGADVWMLLRMVPSEILKAAEAQAAGMVSKVGGILVTGIDGLQSYLSEILPFAHFSTHHGGKRAATVQETGIRVVCANTQSQALDGEAEGLRIRVRHDKGVKTTYEEAVGQLMQGLAMRYLSMANARVILKGVRLHGEQFERLVLETAVPVHHLETKIRNREGNAHTKAAVERAHRLRDEIHGLWIKGKGHEGDQSAWEAYQGLIEFVDHSPNAKHGESRLGSLQTGTLGRVKTRVYADLFEHAALELGA